MKNINKHKVDLDDGNYNALWSGYTMGIIVPLGKIEHHKSVHATTVTGVKGVNCKVVVEIKDGMVSLSKAVPTIDKPTLPSKDFDSVPQRYRFAKLLTYATMYHRTDNWEEDVISNTRDFCELQIRRLNFHDGWQLCGSYETLKKWFIETYNT